MGQEFWEFQKDGYLPEALIKFLALLGWSHPKGKESFSVNEFVKEFDLARVSTTAPVFDREKLDWMNGEYIRQLSIDALAARMGDYLEKQSSRQVDLAFLKRVIPLLRERIKKFGEFESMAGFFFNDVAWSREVLVGKGESTNSVSEKLTAAADLFEKQPSWEAKSLEERARVLAGERAWEVPSLFMLLRVAVTGQTVSPPLFESMAVLGKEKTIARINGALKVVEQAD